MMRPLWMEYPTEKITFDMDDQWLIGSDLLVKPVTAAGATTASVYFPKGVWYDIDTYAAFAGPATKKVEAPLEKIPVYQRGGSIVPRKMRLRRSSALMAGDPYTMVVALDGGGSAEGLVYMDDEHTLKHDKKSEFVVRKLTMQKGSLSCVRVGGGMEAGMIKNEVERVVVVGWKSKPKSVTVSVEGGKEGGEAQAALLLEFEYNGKKKVLTIRKPAVMVDENWTMVIR